MENEWTEKKKRIFIAIDLPTDVKKYIYDFGLELFGKKRHIRPVKALNIHITLKFLGDTAIPKIKKISSAVEQTASSLKSFKYTLNGQVGAFPGMKRARVAYIEIGKGKEDLVKLYGLLEDNLSKIKIRKDKRKFSSHITIARLRIMQNIDEMVKNTELMAPQELECSRITLFESVTGSGSAEYINIGDFSLK